MPCYLPVMQFATSSALRGMLYRAYATRASEEAAEEFRKFDNTEVINGDSGPAQGRSPAAGLPRLRHALGGAQDGRISCTPVIHFLRDLARKARPFAEKDVADLRDFRQGRIAAQRPAAMGLAVHGRKAQGGPLRLQRARGQTVLHRPEVLAGRVQSIETLFDVEISPDSAPVWNPSVSFYRIERVGPQGRN